MRSNPKKWALLALVGAAALRSDYAGADERLLFLVLTSAQNGPAVVQITSATGGIALPSQTAAATPGHAAISTASFIPPITITTSQPSVDLIDFATPLLSSPNGAAPNSDIVILGFSHVTSGPISEVSNESYAHVIPTRIDFPGTVGAGPNGALGPFVITADVRSSATRPLDPTVHTFPSPSSSQPAHFIFEIGGLTPTGTQPLDGYFTIEPFSLTTSSLTNGLSLKLHTTAVTTAAIASWTKTYASGGNATFSWKSPPEFGTGRRLLYFSLHLSGVTMTSSNDADKTAPTAITILLSSTKATASTTP